MSQQLLYRYDYLYHLYRSSFRAARRFATIGAFGDISRPRSSSSSSSSSSCFLRLFVRYLLLQQLLQWVFCGNGSVSGNCCGPYIGMVASWTTGAAVLNHPRHHISTATKRPSIPSSLSSSSSSSSSSPLTPTTRTFQSSPLSLHRRDGANSSSTAVVVVAGAEMDIPTTTAATTTTTNATTADRDATNATTSQCARVMANVHRLPLVHRVHCISDLHVDNADNLRWLESRCRPQNATTTTTKSNATSNTTNQDNRNRNIPENARRERRFDWDKSDMIVVAGDISHQMDRIEHSLLLLKQTGAEVLFVPGNHEAWLAVSSTTPTKSNYLFLSKLEDIETLCRKLGVYTTGDCVCIGGVAPDDASSETEIGPLPSTATTTTTSTTIVYVL